MMMSFCKKVVHSLLGFTNSQDGTTLDYPPPHRHAQLCHHQTFPISAGGGLSLFTIPTDVQKSTKIIQSAAVKSPASASSPPPDATMIDAASSSAADIENFSAVAGKRDPGGIGFMDDVGGTADGLMSCTESLGFESSDERRVDDKIDDMKEIEELYSRKESKWKRKRVKQEPKRFPPPLSSLNHDGKPNFFLRRVRKDGRLELTEVRIFRPEILRASRQDGRLRLRLILDEDEDSDRGGEEDEAEEMAEEEVEDKVNAWKFPTTSGAGDGFRRCYEMVRHHHHHHHNELHVWRQQCVTTR